MPNDTSTVRIHSFRFQGRHGVASSEFTVACNSMPDTPRPSHLRPGWLGRHSARRPRPASFVPLSDQSMARSVLTLRSNTGEFAVARSGSWYSRIPCPLLRDHISPFCLLPVWQSAEEGSVLSVTLVNVRGFRLRQESQSA